MTRIPYISPSMEILPIQLNMELCLLATSTESYEDNGDYNWSTQP